MKTSLYFALSFIMARTMCNEKHSLSNDINRNLETPLAGVRAVLCAQGLPDVEIRTSVRTGDTPPGERDRMRKSPPHIIVTTLSRCTSCLVRRPAAQCSRPRAP